MKRILTLCCFLCGLVACSVTTMTDRYFDLIVDVEYDSHVYRGQTTVRYHKYSVKGSITPESNGVKIHVTGNVPHVEIPGLGMVAVPFRDGSDDRPAVLHRWIASSLKSDERAAKRFIDSGSKESLSVPVDAITQYLVIRGKETLESFNVLTSNTSDKASPKLVSLKLKVSDAVEATSSLEMELPFLKGKGGLFGKSNLDLPIPLRSLR